MFGGAPLERGAKFLQNFSFGGNEKGDSFVILFGWDRFALFQPNFAKALFPKTRGFFEKFLSKRCKKRKL